LNARYAVNTIIMPRI